MFKKFIGYFPLVLIAVGILFFAVLPSHKTQVKKDQEEPFVLPPDPPLIYTGVVDQVTCISFNEVVKSENITLECRATTHDGKRLSVFNQLIVKGDIVMCYDIGPGARCYPLRLMEQLEQEKFEKGK